MPAAATISVTRLRETLSRLEFFPQKGDPTIFERERDHLMLFPDIRGERVTLVDIFRSIQEWQGDEQLTDRFLDALMEAGGLD